MNKTTPGFLNCYELDEWLSSIEEEEEMMMMMSLYKVDFTGTDQLDSDLFASYGLKLSQAEILPAQSHQSHWAAVAYQSRCEP
jgi:hypothetical protein